MSKRSALRKSRKLRRVHERPGRWEVVLRDDRTGVPTIYEDVVRTPNKAAQRLRDMLVTRCELMLGVTIDHADMRELMTTKGRVAARVWSDGRVDVIFAGAVGIAMGYDPNTQQAYSTRITEEMLERAKAEIDGR